MGILSGFFKTKKYRKIDDGYRLQSEWTSSDTVEMNDGTTLSERFAWKNLNENGSHFVGGQTIDISNSNVDELFIKINFTSNIDGLDDIVCTMHIPSSFLQSNGQYFRTGYSYNSANCGVASCFCTDTQITLSEVHLNGKSILNDVKWVVHYR